MWYGASRTTKILQTVFFPPVIAAGTFYVWTKHCHMEDMNLATDPVYQSKWHKKFNPNSNPVMNDVCVRRLPLFKVKPELVEDAQKGGSKLVEAFSQGVWGSFGTLCSFPNVKDFSSGLRRAPISTARIVA